MLKDLEHRLAALDLAPVEADIAAAQARVDEIEGKRDELREQRLELIHKAQRIEQGDRDEADAAARRLLAGESVEFPSATELRARARQLDETHAALCRLAEKARPAVREARQARDQMIADAVGPTVDELRSAMREPFDLLLECYAGAVALAGASGSGAARAFARKLAEVILAAREQHLIYGAPIPAPVHLVALLRKHADKLPGHPRELVDFPKSAPDPAVAAAFSAGVQAGLAQPSAVAR